MEYTQSDHHTAYLADDGNAYIPLTLDLVFQNMRRYLAGQPLQNVVRPELRY